MSLTKRLVTFFLGSKAVTGTKTAVNNATGAAGKASSQVQVIFNGKILTPQSLVQRRAHTSDGHHKKNKVDRGFVDKNETIDEDAPEEPDKPTLPAARSKRCVLVCAVLLSHVYLFLTAFDCYRLESSAGQHTQGMSQIHSKSGANNASAVMALNKQKNVVEEFMTIQLQETTTTTVFWLPSLVMATDTREFKDLDERNHRYEAVIKAHSNVDGFSSRPTQTSNLPCKNQNEMAAPNSLRDAGTQATSYDIKDATSGTDASTHDHMEVGTGTDVTEELAGLNHSVRKFVGDTVGVSLVTPGCLLDTTHVTKPLGYGELANQGKPKHKTRPNATSGVNIGKSGFTQSSAGGGTSGDEAAYEAFGGGVAASKKADSGSASKDNVGSTGSGHNTVDVVNPSGVLTSRANNSSDNNDGIAGDGGPVFSAEDSQELMREAEIATILSNPLLLKRLHMIERAIQQNANHRPQLDYRDLPDIEPLTLLSTERARALKEASEVNYYCFD